MTTSTSTSVRVSQDQLSTFRFDCDESQTDIQCFTDPETDVIWFNAGVKHLGKALGYANADKYLKKHCQESDYQKFNFGCNGKPSTFVTETGLYLMMFGSTLISARKFVRWVASEVLPQIRKTGSYIGGQTSDHVPAQIAPEQTNSGDIDQQLIDSLQRMLYRNIGSSLADRSKYWNSVCAAENLVSLSLADLTLQKESGPWRDIDYEGKRSLKVMLKNIIEAPIEDFTKNHQDYIISASIVEDAINGRYIQSRDMLEIDYSDDLEHIEVESSEVVTQIENEIESSVNYSIFSEEILEMLNERSHKWFYVSEWMTPEQKRDKQFMDHIRDVALNMAKKKQIRIRYRSQNGKPQFKALHQ